MKTEWNLTFIYEDKRKWEKGKQNLIDLVEKLKREIDSFLNDEIKFKNYIEDKIEADLEIEKVYCYPKRHSNIEIDNEEYAKMTDVALDINRDIELLDGMFQKSITENADKVREYLKRESLANHRKYIENIIKKGKHSPRDAKEFAKISERLFKVKDEYRKLIDNIPPVPCTIDGKDYELDRLNFVSLKNMAKTAEDKRSIFLARQRGFEIVSKKSFILLKERFELELKSSNIRGFETVIESSLSPNDLPLSIVYKLIEKINTHLNLYHKYNQFKKDISGLAEYHVYDFWDNSVAKTSNTDFEDAIKEIKEALTPLGRSYVDRIDVILEEGWIDIYPKKHKLPGAFTSMSYIGRPYILMNYDNSPFSVRTLAHEIGHAINVAYTKESCKFEYFQMRSFLSEIVAKVNEFLWNDYLLKSTEDIEERKYILKNIVDVLFNSLYNQVMWTELEDALHKKIKDRENIDVETVNALYLNLFKKYNGEAYTYDSESKYSWVNTFHLVTQDIYYLYQYSISACIAMDIVAKIQECKPGFIEKYEKFLSVDNTVSIEDALRIVDIDLEKGNYCDNAISKLSDMLTELETLYKETK